MRKELAPESFIKAERNLETLGFFTPSSNKLKKLKEKVIQIRRKVDGEVQELTITILPSAKYGLPSTVHQDFYRGFQKLMSAQLRGDGEVPRHIAFTTAELLDSMGIERKRQSGKWYRMAYLPRCQRLLLVESKARASSADRRRALIAAACATPAVSQTGPDLWPRLGKNKLSEKSPQVSLSQSRSAIVTATAICSGRSQ